MAVSVLDRKWGKTNLRISTRKSHGNDTHQADTSRQMRMKKYHSYNKQPAAAAASTAANLFNSAKDTDRQTDRQANLNARNVRKF